MMYFTDESSEPSPRQEDSQVTCPSSYSIIMDNLDFFIHRHNQSIDKSNSSLHWIHHIAVKDRIPTHHISNVKPTTDIPSYNLDSSLPQRSTQALMRREFIVLGTRMLSNHMAVFESFADSVVHHIPHLYSTEMSTRSTDVSCHKDIQMCLYFLRLFRICTRLYLTFFSFLSSP